MPAVWLLVVIAIVVIVVILLFLNQNTAHANNNVLPPFDHIEEDDPFDVEVNLHTFEQFYRSTVWPTRKLRTDYDDSAVLFKFVEDDRRILETLNPFEDAKDFAQLLRTLNAYAVRMTVAGGDDNDDRIVAAQLSRALTTIANKLPMPAPYQRLPWNFDEVYWHVFSVCLTECAMLLSIVLRPYNIDDDVSEIAVRIIENYITEPNMSMGWRRNVGYSTRMCIPYIYAQLYRGFDVKDVVAQPTLAVILEEIRHHARSEEGSSGIRTTDFINYVEANVRNYSFLVENYFTFQYYNFLMGSKDFVVLDNVHNSLHIVGSNSGRIHPALFYKDGTHIMPVIAEIMHYDQGVYSADFSKVVTVRNLNYFASLVCPVNGIAYYQANYDFRKHALLWTMTKRIWSNAYDERFVRKNNPTLLESGVIVVNDDNDDDGLKQLPLNDSILSPNTSMSFLPNPAFTAIATVRSSAAAVASFSKFDALNVEYYSYTLYHRTGMIQLYDQIKVLSKIDRDAYCIVLMLEPDDDNKNNHTSQGCTVRHHNIENYKQLTKFEVRSDGRFVYQPIPMQEINDGEGTVCYSMTTTDSFLNDVQIIKGNTIKRNFKMIVDEIECVFEFPYVLLKDNENRYVTINNAYQSTKHLHTIYFEDIQDILDQVGLRVDDLLSDIIKRTSYGFTFENTQGNQFQFYY